MTKLRTDWFYIKMLYKRCKPDVKLRFCDVLVDINWKMSALVQLQVIAFLCLFLIRRVNRLEPARLLRRLFPRPSFIHNTVNMERFILIDEPKAPQYTLVCRKIRESVAIALFLSSWSEFVWISKVTVWCTIVIHVVIYSHYCVSQGRYIAGPYRPTDIPEPHNGWFTTCGCTVTVFTTIWDSRTYKVTPFHNLQFSRKCLYRP